MYFPLFLMINSRSRESWTFATQHTPVFHQWQHQKLIICIWTITIFFIMSIKKEKTPIHLLVFVKGTQMGPLFVLVCRCFRENVIVTCKIVTLLCSLDNFLLKNVILFFSFCFVLFVCFFFWKSNFKMALIWKRAIFYLLFTFFSHQGKDTKNPSVHISLLGLGKSTKKFKAQSFLWPNLM